MLILPLVLSLTLGCAPPASFDWAHQPRCQQPPPASEASHRRPSVSDLECVDEADSRLERLERREKAKGEGLTPYQWDKALREVIHDTYAEGAPPGSVLGGGALPLSGGRAADFNAEGENRIADLIARCQKLLNDGGVERSFQAELAACGFAPRIRYLPHACIIRMEGVAGPSFTNVYDGPNMPDAMCHDIVSLGVPWSFVQLSLHDRLFHAWGNPRSILPIGQAFRLQHVVLALGAKHGEVMRAIRKLDETARMKDIPAVARQIAPQLKAYLEAKNPGPRDIDLARGHFMGNGQRIDQEALQRTLWMMYQSDKLEAAITFALLKPKGSPDVPAGLRDLANGDFGDWVRLLAASQTNLVAILRQALDEAVTDFRVGTDLGKSMWIAAGGVRRVLDQQVVVRDRQQRLGDFVADSMQAELLADGASAEAAAGERDRLRRAGGDRESDSSAAAVWEAAGKIGDQIVTRQLLHNRVRASRAFLRAIGRAGK